MSQDAWLTHLNEAIGELDREVEKLKDAAYGRQGECLSCYVGRRIAVTADLVGVFDMGRCRCRTNCYSCGRTGVRDGATCPECVDPSVRPMGPET